MHRALLRTGALLVLLAVLAVAGGCIALYTVSRAVDEPDESVGGVGIPLLPPGDPSTTLSTITTAAVTTPTFGGDGQPFPSNVLDTPPVSVPSVSDTPAGTAPPSANATAQPIPTPTETSQVGGPPPHDEIPRPTLPATPL